MWFVHGSAVLVCVSVLGGCLSFYGDDDPGRPTHWPGDDLPRCDTERRAYRIDELRLPTSDDAVDAVGRDLDFDGTIDNMGGTLINVLGSALDADLMAVVSETLADDAVHVAVTVDTCAATGSSLVELHRGLEIDRSRDPPRLLADDMTPYAMVASAPLPGVAADGWSRFPVGSMLHRDEQVWIDGPQFVAVIDAIDDDELDGSLAAAFDVGPLFESVTRAFQLVVADRIAANPGCTVRACPDETLLTLLGVFDDDEDGEVTLEEVRTNSLVANLLRPDIDGDGPVWTIPDGQPDQYSVGVGFHATRVDLFLGQASP